MNTNTSLPYLGRLNPERQTVLRKLKAFADRYILAGGTAIMLHIGHRQSYDFDCFTQEKLPVSLFGKAKRVLGKDAMLILRQTDEMLFVMTPEAVEINFVWYPYPSLHSPVHTPYLPMAHLDDLVCNKAFTLGRRPQWRDYVDLFFLLKWKFYNLETIVRLSEKKFGGEFNAKLFTKQLTYFDDVQLRPTVFLKESYTDEEIKTYLGDQADAYLATVLPEAE
ncbi:nucleotidyl transferase AbiEii/AbiGii toxin family protein [Candidatus Gottesmanbacteria bacterium]|nr:nucleotidyl transferase AbiEii/AbiGii toxin family protein [Candidatus Gottesmanbacteria bacterium]